MLEPMWLPPKEPRRFRTEAEYRRWQHELYASVGRIKRQDDRPGILTRLAHTIRRRMTQRPTVRRSASRIGQRPVKQS